MTKTRILDILPMKIRMQLVQEQFEYSPLQEIRMRIGHKVILQYDGREWIPLGLESYEVSRSDLEEMMEYISQYSLFAYEQEIRQGYITIEGGHRVGFVGKGILEFGKIKSLKYISSINLRIAHEKLGCAEKILPYIVNEDYLFHTLIISPPRCGKTTILRDLIRLLSDGNSNMRGRTIGVVDERSELGACYQGAPQMNLGSRTDILDACPKAEGMMMLVRSMSPEVIMIDELGTEEDIRAVEHVINCGSKLITTIHGDSIESVERRTNMKQLLYTQIFERFIILGNCPKVGTITGVYDGEYRNLY